MAQSRYTGQTRPLLGKSVLVAAFLAGAGAAMVTQNARADGAVSCWGSNNYGQCDPPANLGPCSSVAGGRFHTIAIRSDGEVRCWGAGTITGGGHYGQSIVPANLGSCLSVAAGDYHSIALRGDGTVRCWGSNNSGQCNTPADLGTCISIAAGGSHSIAIRSDGAVRCWGYNGSGSGFGYNSPPADLGPCSSVAAGSFHAIALRIDGAVRCWGENTYGQCNTPANLVVKCSSIAAGESHSIALRSDGLVQCWGYSTFGQCNTPADLGPCSSVAAGRYRTIALRRDGTVRCWGLNNYGSCTPPIDLGPCSSVDSAMGDHSIALRRMTCAGDLNYDHQVNGGDLGVMFGQWATSGGTTGSDLNFDGAVNGGDLGLLLSNWGPCAASIIGITPLEGWVSGGTQITITGMSLGTATAVTVADRPAINVTASPTTVTATTPQGVIGPATVRVTTVTGTVVASQTFNFMPASVSSVTPSFGHTGGGTMITIKGEYLSLTTGVTIGGAAATNVTAVDATTLTAVTPPGALGNADVVITGGMGTIPVPGGFQYAANVVVPSWATLIEATPTPAVVTDAATRAAITATAMAWRVRDTATQIEMVLVPPGTFTMGCTASTSYPCASHENPTHSVTLTQAFYLGRYEVTQAQWLATMGSNPSAYQDDPDAPNTPVNSVSWITIQGFLSSTGMRLPSEAEWEYACRTGTTTAFNNGSNNDNTAPMIAWYDLNTGSALRPHRVGLKAPNALGIYDMHGNVLEWVNDWFGTTYYELSPPINPPGPVSGTYRVLRGGSARYNSGYLRSSWRYGMRPTDETFDWGFRVARTPY
jgi:formylglycine-generating enzyme required for sulfatase activity